MDYTSQFTPSVSAPCIPPYYVEGVVHGVLCYQLSPEGEFRQLSAKDLTYRASLVSGARSPSEPSSNKILSTAALSAYVPPSKPISTHAYTPDSAIPPLKPISPPADAIKAAPKDTRPVIVLTGHAPESAEEDKLLAELIESMEKSGLAVETQFDDELPGRKVKSALSEQEIPSVSAAVLRKHGKDLPDSVVSVLLRAAQGEGLDEVISGMGPGEIIDLVDDLHHAAKDLGLNLPPPPASFNQARALNDLINAREDQDASLKSAADKLRKALAEVNAGPKAPPSPAFDGTFEDALDVLRRSMLSGRR